MNLEIAERELNNELKLRNYSKKTIEAYLFAIRDFAKFNNNRIWPLDIPRVREFLIDKHDRGSSIYQLTPQPKIFYQEIGHTPR